MGVKFHCPVFAYKKRREIETGPERKNGKTDIDREMERGGQEGRERQRQTE